ncbi:hypothetical protein JW711_01255 [Candidatus Woesearchaeota archaeon]|nr:hypothetical protein [Candidatus Woesearchaeota archaeon]
MGLFSKKPSRDDVIAQGLAQQAADAEAAAAEENKKDEGFNSGNPKVDMEIVKIKAQLESYNEIRKANSERFARIGEQMGELRGMVLDTNKTMSKIEVSATKAIDLVESVQPEKLMIEIRKMDGKVESLKANIESNEAMMRDIMEELKKMRQQMNFYKGIEQVTKLNEDVKGELLEIKKVEATIERHADKGESIFLDMEKKFAEYEKFEHKIDDIESVFHVIQNDFDKMKLGISNKSDRKEFITLINKFSEFEKHTSEVLKLLDERNKRNRAEMKDSLKKMKQTVAKKHGLTLEDFEKGELGKARLRKPEGARPGGAKDNHKEGAKKGDDEEKELPDISMKPEVMITSEDAKKVEEAQAKEQDEALKNKEERDKAKQKKKEAEEKEKKGVEKSDLKMEVSKDKGPEEPEKKGDEKKGDKEKNSGVEEKAADKDGGDKERGKSPSSEQSLKNPENTDSKVGSLGTLDMFEDPDKAGSVKDGKGQDVTSPPPPPPGREGEAGGKKESGVEKKLGGFKGFMNKMRSRVEDSIKKSEEGDPSLLGVIGLRRKTGRKEEGQE